MKKAIQIVVESDDVFYQIGEDEIINYLSKKGYGVIAPGESSKYINLEKIIYFNSKRDSILFGSLAP